MLLLPTFGEVQVQFQLEIVTITNNMQLKKVHQTENEYVKADMSIKER